MTAVAATAALVAATMVTLASPTVAHADGFTVAVTVHGSGVVTGGDAGHTYNCGNPADPATSSATTCVFLSAWTSEFCPLGCSEPSFTLRANADTANPGWHVAKWDLHWGSGADDLNCTNGGTTGIRLVADPGATTDTCGISLPFTCICHRNQQIDVYFTRDTNAGPVISSVSGAALTNDWSGSSTSLSYTSEQGTSFVCGAWPSGQPASPLAGCPSGGSSGTDSLSGLSGGLWNFQVEAVDFAGNRGPVRTVTWTVDGSPPQVTISSPTVNAVYSQHQVVEAGYTCSDAVSGVASCDGPVANGEPADTAALGAHTFTVSAVDNAGNTTQTAVSYAVVDVTPPTVTITAPADNATYVRGQVLPANFVCQDEPGGSGVQTPTGCSGTVSNGSPIDTSSLGTTTFTVTGSDKAGNTTTHTVTYHVIVAPPSVTVTVPANNGTYGRGAIVPANYVCQADPAGAGIAPNGCAGTVANGSPIDTSTLGVKTFTVAAGDKAGNQATRTVSYRVVDVTPPTIQVSAPARGAVFVQGQIAIASYACQDEAGGSGLASCGGTVANGGRLDTSHPGKKIYTVIAKDNAGNPTQTTATYAVVPDPTLPATVTPRYRSAPDGRIKIVHLTAYRLWAGSTITMTCKGRGCPRRLAPIFVRLDRSSLVLSVWNGKVLWPGVRLQVKIAKPLTVGVLTTWRVQRAGVPRSELCVPYGGKPRACT